MRSWGNCLSNIILQQTCPVMIILELKFLCFYFPLCWLSFTSNEYFLIVCRIEHWKSQCRKKQTRICHFYHVNIELKYPGTVSVEVLRPPNQPYPQNVLQCTGTGRSCYERDCLEERFCFWWTFGPLSLVAMFCYIGFPQITHGKHIGKKTRHMHTERTKLLNYFQFGK